MGKTYEKLDDDLIAFIKAQKLFFVASAPLSPDGHVNVSPKGLDSLHIADANTIYWLDLGGSGIETQAHAQENGRITMMFCAFEGRANIVRVYGQASVTQLDEPEFPALLALFPGYAKARAVFRVDIESVTDSCGWGVPFFAYQGERDQLTRAIDHMDEAGYAEKRFTTNATSIDGLPGLVRKG